MNKLILVAIVLSVIVGGIIYTQTDFLEPSGEIRSFATGQYFNTLNDYSFATFYGMECQYINEMYVKYQGVSGFSNVAFDSSPTFNPQIQFDITNRETGKIIDAIRIDINQKCTVTDPSFLTGGGAITTTGKALFQLGSGSLGDDLGNEITSLESVALNKQIKDGVWTVITSKTYGNFQQYESDLILHNDVNAWIKAFATIDVDYKFTFNDSTNNFVAGGTDGVGSLLTTSAWLVRADANVITPPQPNANVSNEPIFLTDVTTTLTKSQGGQDGTISQTNSLDTNKQSGRQLLIEGTVRKWLNTEGLPKITITDATGRSLVSGTMLLDTKSGDDGLFVFYYSMPFQSQNGAYTITMEHPNRFQGDFSTLQKSSKVFNVENTIDEPTTSIEQEDGSVITPISTGGTTKSFFGNICLAWTALYNDGDSQNGLICDDTFDIDLGSALSLANQIEGENKILRSVQVSPILQFKTDAITSQFTIETSDVVFDTTIEVGGETVVLDTRNTVLFSPTRALCVDTEQGTTCANKGFSLGSVILGTDALTNKIETVDKIQGLPNGGTTPLSIVVDISGTFTARNDDTGKAYSGSTDGTVFTWDTTYIKGSLGQIVTTETDEETGEVVAVVTTDGTGSGDPNPEKPIPIYVSDEPCSFEGDNYEFPYIECQQIQIFKDHVESRGNDGQCYTAEFFDTDGIGRDVTWCNEVSDDVGIGGASGSAGGGLNNGDEDSPGGILGLGGVCEGTVIQCASAFTENIDEKLKEKIGLDSVELGLVLGGFIFVLIVIAGLVAVAKHRNDSYNPMNYR